MPKKSVVLKSIELFGFKSFASRTKIEFGEGLVAIIGPNGSGKSNIADAIKWVFGEQKTKTLRTDKTEDLIYHGGDSKSRSSMAEVVITLDNSNGKIPLDFNEVEIGRRLYRDGESSYLLNGRKISLMKIQEILSSVGFGVGSYSVIGQGMIEKLILSSGVERKKLFEEASGIRQYEIKLGQTNKRLVSVQQNLVQIDELIKELKPQQQSLERQAGLLARKIALLDQIDSFRLAYVLDEASVISDQIIQLELEEKELRSTIDSLQQEIEALESTKPTISKANDQLDATAIDKKLRSLESKRITLENEIAQKRMQLQQLIASNDNKLELQRIGLEIEQCKKGITGHLLQQKNLQKKIDATNQAVAKVDGKIKIQTQDLDRTKKLLKGSQKTEYLRHCLGLIDVLQESMRSKRPTQDINIVFYKLRRMLRHSINDNSAELALKVGKIQNSISTLLDEREVLTDSQTNEIIKLRALELDSASLNQRLQALQKSKAKLSDNKNTAQSSAIATLKTKLAGLEQSSEALNGEIESQRQLLIDIAAQNDSQQSAEYYTAHEKLNGELILSKQKLELMLEQKSQLNLKLAGTEALKKQWFPKGHRHIKRHNGAVHLTDIDGLNAQLSVLEEINPTVEKSAKEADERMSFLENQRQDLLKSLHDLERISASIEGKINSVFERGFERINKYFAQTFTTLFEGGRAELKLSHQDDDYGIDIVVQLPNKKQQNLSSLSGGEKSLASMALLSAILLSNPAPFVVLDEVDAALDESNTKKFAEAIADITKHSQVLVITHNHDTMSVADELIGVTTSGQNDSHILRARLDNLPTKIPVR